ncbi:hypothetical protein PM082_005419 [Marasmius tenuissimus]|nr:hypothetical protein PM082_005419 [Marasmius tenuissimus]
MLLGSYEAWRHKFIMRKMKSGFGYGGWQSTWEGIQKAPYGMLWLGKFSYATLVSVVVVPVLLGRLVDLCMVIPVRLVVHPGWVPSFQVLDVWALGVLYGIIIVSTINRGPRADNRVIRRLQEVQLNGLAGVDFMALTHDVMWPLLVIMLAAVLFPTVVFHGLRFLEVVASFDDKALLNYIYPGFAVVAFIAIGWRPTYEKVAVVVQEEEFLVETRLNNFESGSR